MGKFEYTLNRWRIPADGSLIQCPLGMGLVVKTVWLKDWDDFEIHHECDAYFLSNTNYWREMPDWGNMSFIVCGAEEDAEPIMIVGLGILIAFSDGDLSGGKAWLLYEDFDANTWWKRDADTRKLIPRSDTWFSEVRDGYVND